MKKKTRSIRIGSVRIGGGRPLVMISGPCVIESRAHCLKLAGKLVALSQETDTPLIFKASFDKANRTAISSYRGPGLVDGLKILAEVRERYGIPVLTDVHEPAQARAAGEVVDVLQIPAFLCRQTDLLLAAGETGAVVNVKKGQFLSPWDAEHIVTKVESTGNKRIVLTERGTSYGYNNLVADMRSLLVMRDFGYPIVFDATHSVQRPGGLGGASGGDACWAPYLARAAVAVGCDGVFCETHENPARALSDGANAIPFREVRKLWSVLRQIDTISA